MSRQARCLAVARRTQVAMRVGLRAEVEARHAGAPDALAIALQAQALALHFQGLHEGAITKATEAMAVKGASAGSQANAIFARAVAEMFLYRLPEAREHYRQALSIAQGLEEPMLTGRILLGMGGEAHRAWRADEALEFNDRALEHAREHHFDHLQNLALANGASVLVELGQFDQAISRLLEAETLALRVGGPPGLLTNRLYRADVLIESGRSAEAVALMSQILDGSTSGFDASPIYFAEVTLAEALIDLPRAPRERIERLLESTRERSEKTPKLRIAWLILQLEWRTRADVTESTDSTWVQYLDLRAKSDFAEPKFTARAILARVVSLLQIGRAHV